MNTGKIVIGVLAGLAVGAAMGVLFAPRKGSETRKKIARKGEDLVDNLKEKFEGSLENVSEKTGSLKKEAKNIVQQ